MVREAIYTIPGGTQGSCLARSRRRPLAGIRGAGVVADSPVSWSTIMTPETRGFLNRGHQRASLTEYVTLQLSLRLPFIVAFGFAWEEC